MSILIFAETPLDALAKCIELGVEFKDVIWVREYDMLGDMPAEKITGRDVHYTEKFRVDKPEAFEKAKAVLGDKFKPKRDQ